MIEEIQVHFAVGRPIAVPVAADYKDPGS